MSVVLRKNLVVQSTSLWIWLLKNTSVKLDPRIQPNRVSCQISPSASLTAKSHLVMYPGSNAARVKETQTMEKKDNSWKRTSRILYQAKIPWKPGDQMSMPKRRSCSEGPRVIMEVAVFPEMLLCFPQARCSLILWQRKRVPWIIWSMIARLEQRGSSM